jgi:hypothetical protein
MEDFKKQLENSEQLRTFWKYFKVKGIKKKKQYIILKVRNRKKNIFSFDYIKISISKQQIDNINSYGKITINTGDYIMFADIYWFYRDYDHDTLEEAIEFLSKVVKNPLLP